MTSARRRKSLMKTEWLHDSGDNYLDARRCAAHAAVNVVLVRIRVQAVTE